MEHDHEPRDYIHCIKCHVPLEQPAIKRCETETWYLDFAVCGDCKADLMKMPEPVLALCLSGETLKMLLRTKDDEIMIASVLSEEEASGTEV